MTGAGRPGYWNNRIVQRPHLAVPPRAFEGSEWQLPFEFAARRELHRPHQVADARRSILCNSHPACAAGTPRPVQSRLSRLQLDRSWATRSHTIRSSCSTPASTIWCRTTANPDVEIKGYRHSRRSWARCTPWPTSTRISDRLELTGNVGVQAVHTDQSSQRK